MTTPVAMSGCTKLPATTGSSLPVTGATTVSPTTSLPCTVACRASARSNCHSSLVRPCLETSQTSLGSESWTAPSSQTRTSSYVSFGWIHTFVAPYTVSGRSVAQGSTTGSSNTVPAGSWNLSARNSRTSALPPCLMSVSDLSTATGPATGQNGA